MNKKKVVMFLLALTFFVILVPACQASYSSLKSNYIANNPGQSLIPFPWDPISNTKILPFDFEVPAAPGNTVSITACPDQTEAASFILSSQKDLSGIQISTPALSNGKGSTIPASAINIRTVKVWYQSANDDMFLQSPGYFLTPELLLKDDSLVKVDYTKKINYLKVTINGVSQYVDISSRSAVFPTTAKINDATTLQPFALKADENKQIWLTVHVPKNTPAGDYTGSIAVTAPSEKTVQMKFTVKVLPFTLASSPIDYGLYYRGMLPSTASESAGVGISSIWKTPAQYAIELQNMRDHGVTSPTLNQWSSGGGAWATTFDQALSLRQDAGFPANNLFALGLCTGNPTDSYSLSTLKTSVLQWNAAGAKYGYKNVYIGGIDEADSSILKTEATAWKTVHSTGAKIFAPVSTNLGAYDVVGNTLDLVALAGPISTAQVSLWHGNGKKIYSYANPQVGVEDPYVYRKNYGYALYNAGYDGTLDYAYQDTYGKNIWNDYDTPNPNGGWVGRDHVFAYPTSNGVIDTIEWEGWQEGVDDTRYLATLIKQDGSSTAAKALVASSLAAKDSMATIRGKIIQKISPGTTTSPDPSPAIDATSPDGGENWILGTTPTITWTSADTTGASVKIELLKGSTVVQTITSSTPNDGSYASWTIPTTLSTGSDYKIRITSTTDTTKSDLSESPFTIGSSSSSSSSIVVTSPDGGETLTRGTSPAITWTSTASDASVKIELLKGSTVVQTIDTSTPNDGTYASWTIPTTLTSGTDYKIRITGTTNTGTTDSGSSFTIGSVSSLTVTSPDGGETLTRGTSPAITWTSTASDANVKIELLKGSTVVQTIDTSTPNDGTYASWTIPTTLTSGTDYKIRITGTTNTGTTDSSDSSFTIGSPSSFTVTSPDGGETLTRGTSPAITWTSTSSDANVKIELLKGSTVVQTIDTSTPNDGTYASWTVPTSLASGTDYKIRITGTTNTGTTDSSDSSFTIGSTGSSGSITYTTPAGGETWVRGTTPTITWVATGTTGEAVKIELLKSGTLVKTIDTSTPNDGKYASWTIPTTFAVGTDYQIRITSTSNAAIKDTSNGYFTITSS